MEGYEVLDDVNNDDTQLFLFESVSCPSAFSLILFALTIP